MEQVESYYQIYKMNTKGVNRGFERANYITNQKN